MTARCGAVGSTWDIIDIKKSLLTTGMESEVLKPGVKQTFTWSTPFFDVTFVDIKTKKGRIEQLTRKNIPTSLIIIVRTYKVPGFAICNVVFVKIFKSTKS